MSFSATDDKGFCEQYLERRSRLKLAFHCLDLAARRSSVPGQEQLAFKAIAALTGYHSIESDHAALYKSWVNFTSEGAADMPPLARGNSAFDAVTAFLRRGAAGAGDLDRMEPGVAEVLRDIELCTRLLSEHNERNKPGALRRAAWRAFAAGVAILAGLAGLVYGMWMAWGWISPGGMQITYFNGIDFNSTAAHRVCDTLDIDYGTDRPAWGVKRKYWSARWEGYLVAPADDDYSFYVQSMDGVRLFIDNQCLVDNWREQEWQSSGRHAEMRLAKGKHRLVMEHYTSGGPAAIRVRWMGGGIPANSILKKPYLRKR